MVNVLFTLVANSICSNCLRLLPTPLCDQNLAGICLVFDCRLLILSLYLTAASVLSWSFVPRFLKLMIQLSSQVRFWEIHVSFHHILHLKQYYAFLQLSCYFWLMYLPFCGVDKRTIPACCCGFLLIICVGKCDNVE